MSDNTATIEADARHPVKRNEPVEGPPTGKIGWILAPGVEVFEVAGVKRKVRYASLCNTALSFALTNVQWFD